MNDEGMEILRARRSSRETSLLKPVRRIVTGYDDKKRAILVSDGIPPRVQTLSANGPTCYEIWSTRGSPAHIDHLHAEPQVEDLSPAPPARGTRIQVMDVLPEAPPSPGDRAPTGSARTATGRYESIDYGIVLQGELTLILAEREIVLAAGDIVVQLGTNHTWANRSGRLCRIALVLVDATFDQPSQ